MKFKLKSLVAAMIAAPLFVGMSAPAMADTTEDLVKALIKKGVLTTAEGELLLKDRKTEKAAPIAPIAPLVKVKDGAISLESADGKNSIQVTGRLHLDYRGSDIDGFSNVAEGRGTAFDRDRDTSSAASQFEIRRARIGVKGKLLGDFDYEVITNILGSSANLLDVAYLTANISTPLQFRVGQYKQPFNLEEIGTSSNNIDFQERSFINQITPGKRVGAMIFGTPTPGVTYAASYYQQNNFGETDSAVDGNGYVGRVTVNFAELAGWKNSILHAGLAGFDSTYGLAPSTSGNTSGPADTVTRASLFSFRSSGRGLNNIYRAQIAGDVLASPSYSTLSPTAADLKNKAYGLEGIAATGPFKVQAEYVNSDFEANHANTGNRVDATVKTYYVEALWLITGESYANFFKNGAWGSIKPKQNFGVNKGEGTGAWELGVRYENFKVDDTNIVGSTSSRFQGSTTNLSAGNLNTNNAVGANRTQGGADAWTVGLKWVLNPSVRVLLNYTKTNFDTPFRPIDVSTVATAATTTPVAPAVGASNASIKTFDSESLVTVRAQISF